MVNKDQSSKDSSLKDVISLDWSIYPEGRRMPDKHCGESQIQATCKAHRTLSILICSMVTIAAAANVPTSLLSLEDLPKESIIVGMVYISSSK